jgi:hypothetical protein
MPGDIVAGLRPLSVPTRWKEKEEADGVKNVSPVEKYLQSL